MTRTPGRGACDVNDVGAGPMNLGRKFESLRAAPHECLANTGELTTVANPVIAHALTPIDCSVAAIFRPNGLDLLVGLPLDAIATPRSQSCAGLKHHDITAGILRGFNSRRLHLCKEFEPPSALSGGVSIKASASRLVMALNSAR